MLLLLLLLVTGSYACRILLPWLRALFYETVLFPLQKELCMRLSRLSTRCSIWLLGSVCSSTRSGKTGGL